MTEDHAKLDRNTDEIIAFRPLDRFRICEIVDLDISRRWQILERRGLAMADPARKEFANGGSGCEFDSCRLHFVSKQALRLERRRAFLLWGKELRHRASSSIGRFRGFFV